MMISLRLWRCFNRRALARISAIDRFAESSMYRGASETLVITLATFVQSSSHVAAAKVLQRSRPLRRQQSHRDLHVRHLQRQAAMGRPWATAAARARSNLRVDSHDAPPRQTPGPTQRISDIRPGQRVFAGSITQSALRGLAEKSPSDTEQLVVARPPVVAQAVGHERSNLTPRGSGPRMQKTSTTR